MPLFDSLLLLFPTVRRQRDAASHAVRLALLDDANRDPSYRAVRDLAGYLAAECEHLRRRILVGRQTGVDVSALVARLSQREGQAQERLVAAHLALQAAVDAAYARYRKAVEAEAPDPLEAALLWPLNGPRGHVRTATAEMLG